MDFVLSIPVYLISRVYYSRKLYKYMGTHFVQIRALGIRKLSSVGLFILFYRKNESDTFSCINRRLHPCGNLGRSLSSADPFRIGGQGMGESIFKFRFKEHCKWPTFGYNDKDTDFNLPN